MGGVVYGNGDLLTRESAYLFTTTTTLAIVVYLFGDSYLPVVLALLTVVFAETFSRVSDSWRRDVEIYPYAAVFVPTFFGTLYMITSTATESTPSLAMGAVVGAAILTIIRGRVPGYWWGLPVVYLPTVAFRQLQVGHGLPVVAVVAVSGLFTFSAYREGVTDLEGSMLGFLLAALSLNLMGFRWFLLLGLFVVVGAATTRYRRERKHGMGLRSTLTETRGFSNVLANGIVAGIGALIFGYGLHKVGGLVFAAGLASAAADTASSEIGSVSGNPRLLWSWKEVQPGTDGAVSLVGEVMAFVASIGFGVSILVLGLAGLQAAISVALGGLVGVHLDSVLGATAENRWLDNGTVNLLSCAGGAGSAVLLHLYVF
ncbi:MAG: TIGR00297 family protein [Halobacteria archaeon]